MCFVGFRLEILQIGERSIEDNKLVFRKWKATGNQQIAKRKVSEIEEKHSDLRRQ